MKTRAAILVESNQPLVVDEIELPSLGVGQVLVKIAVSGICGAQLGEIAAVKGPDKFLPHLLGHEAGGVVEEVGPGVTHVKPGDHVCLHWRKGAGIHAQPARYLWNGRTVHSGWVTTFSDYAIVSENRVTPIPKETKFEIAALLGCAVTTALGLINNDAQVKIGQSVAVFGCGGVGLNVVQAAAMVSAHPIIGIDLHDRKLEFARRLGATHTLNSQTADLRAEIQKIAGAVDVAIENTGSVRLIELAYELTAPQGRTILVGVPRQDQDITIHSLPLHFGKVLTGCEGGQTNPTVDIPRYLRLYRAGKLQLDPLITHRFPLEQVNDALAAVRSGETGRCVLEMQ
jgi:S-(hydroxymethyl)glutathione dehydrogenase / alcohol dehydrogenase